MFIVARILLDEHVAETVKLIVVGVAQAVWFFTSEDCNFHSAPPSRLTVGVAGSQTPSSTRDKTRPSERG